MDRPHSGPGRPARTSGATVTANLPAAAEPKTANLIEARSLHLSSGRQEVSRAPISIAVISNKATGLGPGRLPASQPLLAVPEDPGQLGARAVGPAHRRDHLAGPPSGGLKHSGGSPVESGAYR